MKIDKSILKSYNKQRTSANNRILCHAPFQSINFTQNGNATACCYNKKHVLGNYPDHSIHEMWFGDSAGKLRKYIRENDLSYGCQTCALQLNSQSFSSVHARNFDYQSDNPVKHWLKKALTFARKREFVAYPRLIEFELSNTCNLECVMCFGYFSSSIRKNRENKPPMKLVFDDAFVKQLDEFIPHLTDAKFLGGEPFLIPIYFKIWERIIALNPRCRVHITTNATIINEKSWSILNQLRCNIVVSIDAIQEESYNRIRQGADWKVVHENIEKLKEYTLRKKTHLTFSVCPMSINWKEIPEIIQYGIDHKISIYFNTVTHPEHLSLLHVSPAEAREIYDLYKKHVFSGEGFYYTHNLKQIESLANFVQYTHHIEE